MRILLVSTNREVLPDPVFPLGLACLSGALRESRHDHFLLDLCFEEDWAGALERAVADFKPEAVGLSIRNIDNVAFPNFHSYLPFCKEMVHHVRRLTLAPIILGGSGFSVMPAPILDYLNADYGIAGEAEWNLVQLLDRLEDRVPAHGLPGLYRASDPPSVQALIAPACTDARQLPRPVRTNLDSRKYLDRGGMGNIQTKRGCSFACIYCTYPLIEGRQVRLRSPSDVVDEMAQEIDAGVDTFFIVDDIFNFPPHHARSICQGILDQGLKVRWSCYLHPQFVTESLLGLMKDAGCTSVECGIDSGSDAQLARLGKCFTGADIRRTSELCRTAGIPFCHSLIFGGPGEDDRTIRETFDLMEELNPTAVIAMVGIRVFPGTELARSASREDLILTGNTLLEPTFYIARSCRPFLLDRIQTHAARHSNWILPGSNVNIDNRLQSRLRKFGLRGPLWEYMRVRRIPG
jgi:radical SAM superfamily enzyme YgiQ (UPF0313 family)